MSMRAGQFSLVGFLCSLLLASLLDVVRLPSELMLFRPQFVLMVLIYWMLFLPTKVGVYSAWSVGIWVDSLHGDVLGVRATSFAVMAYCVFFLYQRIRVFPLWQQAAVIGMLIVMQMVITRTLLGLIDRSVSESFGYYWPALTSACMWPLCVNLMHRWRQI